MLKTLRDPFFWFFVFVCCYATFTLWSLVLFALALWQRTSLMAMFVGTPGYWRVQLMAVLSGIMAAACDSNAKKDDTNASAGA